MTGIEVYLYGEMAEWLKAPDSKSGLGESLTWVRIPLSPPVLLLFDLYIVGLRSALGHVPLRTLPRADLCPPCLDQK
jgi:hypothetical protein